ncbi:hypothetical protein LTR36_010026 [Oleoguttula mirabilis]|uniref:Uncharacterized protein n=1 Tax=Oleoguttula mirabilis TaxID=1507867 RepID=A0AAV9JRL1_9PEZI|nr:hypothetical protein LTR36_010026 [Oleoguttula mirabilis]
MKGSQRMGGKPEPSKHKAREDKRTNNARASKGRAPKKNTQEKKGVDTTAGFDSQLHRVAADAGRPPRVSKQGVPPRRRGLIKSTLATRASSALMRTPSPEPMIWERTVPRAASPLIHPTYDQDLSELEDAADDDADGLIDDTLAPQVVGSGEMDGSVRMSGGVGMSGVESSEDGKTSDDVEMSSNSVRILSYPDGSGGTEGNWTSGQDVMPEQPDQNKSNAGSQMQETNTPPPQSVNGGGGTELASVTSAIIPHSHVASPRDESLGGDNGAQVDSEPAEGGGDDTDGPSQAAEERIDGGDKPKGDVEDKDDGNDKDGEPNGGQSPDEDEDEEDWEEGLGADAFGL